MELIPGLPNHVGLECLTRIPYHHFPHVASVCRTWKSEIELPEFWLCRKLAGLTRSVVVMAQYRVDRSRTTGVAKFSAIPVIRLAVCELETGGWSELPPIRDCSDGLPMFCQMTGVGRNLVLMGGWNPVTLEVSNAVFIYNFVTGTWRRGADMPGGRRLFFACASDFDRTVFVAGGNDDEKNALRSAMAYDVATDEWISLPDMARHRDECQGVFHRGKFHVISGYCTELQGRFEKSAESYDVATRQWEPIREDFLEVAACPKICVDDGEGRMYMCQCDDLVARDSATWKTVAKVPADLRDTTYMTGWQGKLLVIGYRRFGEPPSAYVLNIQNYTWKKVEVPKEFSGHVQSGCCLEI